MFGDTFRELLKACDIKMYFLASELGYDKSYLSKWGNNTKLPPKKEIAHLCDDIAGILIQHGNSHELSFFAEQYGIASEDGTFHEEELRCKFASVLLGSYWETRNALSFTGIKQSEQKVKEIFFVFQENEPFFSYNILSALVKEQQDGQKIRLVILIDPEEYNEHIANCCRFLLWALELSAQMDVAIYELDPKPQKDLPRCFYLVKDESVHFCIEDVFAGNYYPVTIHDKIVVDGYYKSLERFLSVIFPITVSGFESWNIEYNKALITHLRLYLLAQMLPLYLDEKLLDILLKRANVPSSDIENCRFRYIHEFGEERIIFICESVLIRCFYDHTLYIASQPVVITKEEMLSYIQELIRHLQKNSRIHFRILQDRNPFFPYTPERVSLIISEQTAYFMSGTSRNFIVSSRVCSLLNSYLNIIAQSDDPSILDEESSIQYLINALSLLEK